MTDFHMVAVHISKHSLFRLKITVVCRLCTCPSIHFSLDEDTLKITVGCLVCGVWVVCVHVVLCVCVGGGGVCVVLLWWCVCVVCGEAWHTLSLLLSLLPLLFPFRFPFLFLSSFSFSLAPSLTLALALVLSLFLLFSPPNTMERTDQPTRRPTSRHLNVIWRRASAQQSVLSLLLSPPSSLLPLSSSKKKRKLFITGIFPTRELFLHYSLKLIPKKRRRVKLQSLQFCFNSKTINLHHVKSVIMFAKMVDM